MRHDLSLTNILVYLSTLGLATSSVFDFFFLDFEAAAPDVGAISSPAARSRTQSLDSERIK